MDFKNKSFIRKENGNVLFLILIAVALFAALSYAVTSSSRSGGGNSGEESNLVRSASVTQYPSSLRTAIIRMMVSNGIDAQAIVFAPPSAFSTQCDTANKQANCVFYPTGGGASPNSVPADLMATGAAGEWYFTGDFEIANVGTSDTAATTGSITGPGNDIIAFLPGISTALCTKINEELGISGNTTDAGANWDIQGADQLNDTSFAWNAEADIIGDAATLGLSGQAFGCLTDNAGEHIYYHVLIER